MKVLFLEDVPGTADAGQVKEVKNGFARNYLIPRKFAVQATANELQRINAIHRQAQGKRLQLSGDARRVAEALEGQAVTIEMRVGPSGRLFGAVTGRRIAEELNQLTALQLDHRNVLLNTAIHAPGDYDVTVRLYREVTSQIKVRIVPEGYQPGDALPVGSAAEETEEAAADKSESKEAPEQS